MRGRVKCCIASHVLWANRVIWFVHTYSRGMTTHVYTVCRDNTLFELTFTLQTWIDRYWCGYDQAMKQWCYRPGLIVGGGGGGKASPRSRAAVTPRAARIVLTKSSCFWRQLLFFTGGSAYNAINNSSRETTSSGSGTQTWHNIKEKGLGTRLSGDLEIRQQIEDFDHFGKKTG